MKTRNKIVAAIAAVMFTAGGVAVAAPAQAAPTTSAYKITCTDSKGTRTQTVNLSPSMALFMQKLFVKPVFGATCTIVKL